MCGEMGRFELSVCIVQKKPKQPKTKAYFLVAGLSTQTAGRPRVWEVSSKDPGPVGHD